MLDKSTDTELCPPQLYTTMLARPRSYGFGRTTTLVTVGSELCVCPENVVAERLGSLIWRIWLVPISRFRLAPSGGQYPTFTTLPPAAHFHSRARNAGRFIRHVVLQHAARGIIVAAEQNIGRARVVGQRAVVERDVSVEMDVVELPLARIREDVHAIPELVEHDVVPRRHRPGVAAQVDRVPMAAVRSLPALVVDDATHDLDVVIRRLVVERHAAVVYDQVDVLRVVRVVRHDIVAALGGREHAIGIRVDELEAPVDAVLPADVPGAGRGVAGRAIDDRATGNSTATTRSEEHTSEL